jgi:hypothetical protein
MIRVGVLIPVSRCSAFPGGVVRAGAVGDVPPPAVRTGRAPRPCAGQYQPADQRGPGQGHVLGDEAAERSQARGQDGRSQTASQGLSNACPQSPGNSDSASDYGRSPRQTQRDNLRLS